MLQALLKTWTGQLLLLIVVGCAAFGWVWLVLHDQITATLLLGIFSTGGGVHYIHTTRVNGGTGGAGGQGGAGGAGGAGGSSGANGH